MRPAPSTRARLLLPAVIAMSYAALASGAITLLRPGGGAPDIDLRTVAPGRLAHEVREAARRAEWRAAAGRRADLAGIGAGIDRTATMPAAELRSLRVTANPTNPAASVVVRYELSAASFLV